MSLHELIDRAKPEDLRDALKEALYLIYDVATAVGTKPHLSAARIEQILRGVK